MLWLTLIWGTLLAGLVGVQSNGTYRSGDFCAAGGEGPGGRAGLEKEPRTLRVGLEGPGPVWVEIASEGGPEAAGPWTQHLARTGGSDRRGGQVTS